MKFILSVLVLLFVAAVFADASELGKRRPHPRPGSVKVIRGR